MKRLSSVQLTQVGELIWMIRGKRVMLASHLARLYGVETKVLMQSVRRNISRFPADFMFQITGEELRFLRSQFVTLNGSKPGAGRGKHQKYLPYAFTEQGVAMLSTVLHSEWAVQVNIAIMRAFVRLREILSSHSELAAKLKELESKLEGHDEQITAIFEAIRELMARPQEEGKRIGF